MKKIIFVLTILIVVACNNGKQPILGETEWQKEMNRDFKDATKSPLKEKDRKDFKGLDFFKFDSTYVVSAKLTRTPDAQPFKMKTTTDRLPNYKKFGVVEFELERNIHKLDIFQNLDILEEEGYEDYLFLPFLDNTNGEGSYSGGRYVEGRIPDGDTIILDFNTAYNPYCAYNDKYSCPIVPRSNYVDVYIKAGVKAFDKH